MVGLRPGGRQRDAAIARIERDLDPGPLTLSFSGPTAAVRQATDDAIDALWPLAFGLLVLALAAVASLGRRAAGALLLAAAAASALAALVSELAGGRFDVSWLALVGAVSGGTLLSLQLYSMAAAGSSPGAVWAAGLAAAATFASVALLGVGYLTSLGFGGALGCLLAAPASLTAVGAAEAAAEPRIKPAARAPWRGLAGLIGWSRPAAGIFALLALGLLSVVAVPALRLATAAIGRPSAPAIGAGALVAAAGAAALATLLVAVSFGRRPGIALGATLAAALPALGAAGLLVISFQEGRFEGPLAFSSNGALQLGSAAAAISVVAALGAAQAVALLAAAGSRSAGLEGVREAIGRCGPAAALSCLGGVAAGLAVAAGSPGFVKQFGLGVAAGLLLELSVVQALLAPALLGLASVRGGDQ